FRTEEIGPFKELFEEISPQIRNFEGCSKLELLQQVDQPEVFLTYSYWDSEEALNNYRYSELFKGFWKIAKSKFEAKPEAWSHHKIASL
ncbi:MAG TPA: antibiotic biosynthesis monooxygenase family protein, partial [Chitinophagales bacterium]|nr:antibiotic biosynthesis monooxygenase family protein [Chitinophagales bacterium]